MVVLMDLWPRVLPVIGRGDALLVESDTDRVAQYIGLNLVFDFKGIASHVMSRVDSSVFW